MTSNVVTVQKSSFGGQWPHCICFAELMTCKRSHPDESRIQRRNTKLCTECNRSQSSHTNVPIIPYPLHIGFEPPTRYLLPTTARRRTMFVRSIERILQEFDIRRLHRLENLTQLISTSVHTIPRPNIQSSHQHP